MAKYRHEAANDITCMQDGVVIKVYCIGGFKETAQYDRYRSLVHKARLKLDQYAVVN